MRLLNKLCFVFWLFVPLITATAQYRFDSWTADNGLPQNSVYSIVQTADGYLWFTTFDGLVRYDGVRFYVFNKSNSKGLTTNLLTNMFAEENGTLWIGTPDNGLVRYQNGQFQTFTTADGLSYKSIEKIQKDVDGSILISTADGDVTWQNNRFTNKQLYDFRNRKTYISPSNTRWELTAAGLTATKDGRRKRSELPFNAAQITVNSAYNYLFYVPLFEDRDGALWFSASGKLFKLKDDNLTTYTAKDGVPQSRAIVITQDHQGNIWLGTEKDGACLLAENKMNCQTTANGLSSNYVMDIFTDRESTIWISTYEKGINRVTKQVVTPLSTADGLPDKNVYPILEDRQGVFWIGSFTSLSNYKNGKFTNFTQKEGLIFYIVQSLLEDRDGRLWIGSIGGVEYLENGKFTDFTEKLGIPVGNADFWDIHQTADGVLWFATSIGVFKYENGTATHYKNADGLPSENVKAIHESSDGSIWFGTYSGLAHLKDGKMQSWTENEGLVGNHIRTIYEDAENTLWIGTYESGLSRFKDGKFTNYTTANGLFSNGVFQILEDAHGNFWMSSNQGIYRVSRRQLNDFADGKISAITSTFFGKSDGMLNRECNGGRSPAGIKASDGRLWFPTQDGVAIIDPANVEFNPLPPPVVIESVKIDSIEQSKIQNPKSKIELKPNQNNLEIHYTGLSFIKPEQVRFRYKLEGLDENWTEAANRREAFYPYLPPGTYTFRVIAANSDNVWNEQGAEIEIVVMPPFYRRPWFTILSVLLAVGIVYVLYKRRISQLTKERIAQQTFSRQLIASQEQERKRIAAELHDSLGQRLVVIKNLALMFLNVKKSDANEFGQIEEISAEASQAIGEVKEISYNLRPYQLDRIGLTKAIEAIVRTAKSASTIEFSAEIDDIDNYFPKETEINFYRIVQECVNNVVKHSEAAKAFVKIKNSDETIKLEIGDNGKGFTPFQTESKTGGFGLIGITERAELFGGKVEIKSAPNQGTVVRIRINNRNFSV